MFHSVVDLNARYVNKSGHQARNTSSRIPGQHPVTRYHPAGCADERGQPQGCGAPVAHFATALATSLSLTRLGGFVLNNRVIEGLTLNSFVQEELT
jgi:hypothetical protein